MKNLIPTSIVVPDFDPVPRRYRYDGWTAERQRAFIAALAETGSVTHAARRINMASEGAYYLRRQPGAEGFRAAWSAALAHGVQRLTDIAIDRAIDGVPVPVFHKGEQVGERRWYNDKLLMFLLKHHLPALYGPPLPPSPRDKEAIARLKQQWEAEHLPPVMDVNEARDRMMKIIDEIAAESEEEAEQEARRQEAEWLEAQWQEQERLAPEEGDEWQEQGPAGH